MTTGGSQSDAPRKDLERWLQMAESALFPLRALGQRMPQHFYQRDLTWYNEATANAPDTYQSRRIAVEFARQLRLPADHPVQVLTREADLIGWKYGLTSRIIECCIEAYYEQLEGEAE